MATEGLVYSGCNSRPFPTSSCFLTFTKSFWSQSQGSAVKLPLHPSPWTWTTGANPVCISHLIAFINTTQTLLPSLRADSLLSTISRGTILVHSKQLHFARATPSQISTLFARHRFGTCAAAADREWRCRDRGTFHRPGRVLLTAQVNNCLLCILPLLPTTTTTRHHSHNIPDRPSSLSLPPLPLR